MDSLIDLRDTANENEIKKATEQKAQTQEEISKL